MVEVKKDKVIISRKKWKELKKDDYFKDLIEVLEDSEYLENSKRKTTSYVKLRDYVKEREKKDYSIMNTEVKWPLFLMTSGKKHLTHST